MTAEDFARLQKQVLECLSAGDGLTPGEIRHAIARKLGMNLRAVDVRMAAQALYDQRKIELLGAQKLLTTTRLYRRLTATASRPTPGGRQGPTGPGAAA